MNTVDFSAIPPAPRTLFPMPSVFRWKRIKIYRLVDNGYLSVKGKRIVTIIKREGNRSNLKALRIFFLWNEIN